MHTLTVRYFDHKANHSAVREHVIADVTPPNLEGVVDLFDGQIGTVLTIHEGENLLYRSMAEVADLVRR